ncbi:hypothetical protein HDU81_000309 [Chytriomyces hyalinus]|nr:hypothetical protein HDU81_000309 [Chytriomyces hyalinus]
MASAPPAATAPATTTTATWSDSSTLLTDSEDETPLSEIGHRLRMSRISVVSHRDSHNKRVSFIARESDSHSPTAPSPTTVQLPAHKLRKPIQSALKKHSSCIQLSGKSASVSTLLLASKSVSVSTAIPVYRSTSDPLDHIPIAMLASASVQRKSPAGRRLSFAVDERKVDEIVRASSESSAVPVILPRQLAETPVRSFSLSRLPSNIESRPEPGSVFKHRSHSILSLRKQFSKASVKGTVNRVTDTRFTHDEFASATGISKYAANESKIVDRTDTSNRSSSVPLLTMSPNAKKRWSWAWARK